MMKNLVVATLLIGMAVTAKAGTIVYLTGHVVNVESTYMPGRARFYLDKGDSACPAGMAIDWWSSNPNKVANADNTKAAYSTVLAALLSGRTVTAIYDTANVHLEGPGNCKLTFLVIN
jgi:hypothetical protein